MKKILFITGTRADYGKLKPLIREVERAGEFEAYIYVSGMHLMEVFGCTYREIIKDGYRNVYTDFAQIHTDSMSYNLGDVICHLTGFAGRIRPDLMVVHGDRIDALAGAVVGALNNIRVAHIEGGEVSGTIDESIRHAISKFAHLHLVCNEEAGKRLVQLGEEARRIHVIGSPDIDIMLSGSLPSIDKAKARYDIPYGHYGIFMYHPVTTDYPNQGKKIQEVVDALLESGRDYIVIYPNNDKGSEILLNEYKRMEGERRFCLYPSLRFEYFLTLLKHADFMIGNSSAGVRESSVYGIPAIDIGSRQEGRYSLEKSRNLQHVDESREEILEAIGHAQEYRFEAKQFGDGKSAERFMELLRGPDIWDFAVQKRFVDLSSIL